jgi:holo-[acyl-carrier protein] synthase
MLVGIGFDLVDLGRFRALYGNFDPDLLARCFSAEEQSEVGRDEDCLTRLAARFAAKEAVLKVLGGLRDGISLSDITVRSSGSGQPHLVLSGGARDAAEAVQITSWLISLTHTDSTAGAVAIAMAGRAT